MAASWPPRFRFSGSGVEFHSEMAMVQSSWALISDTLDNASATFSPATETWWRVQGSILSLGKGVHREGEMGACNLPFYSPLPAGTILWNFCPVGSSPPSACLLGWRTQALRRQPSSFSADVVIPESSLCWVNIYRLDLLLPNCRVTAFPLRALCGGGAGTSGSTGTFWGEDSYSTPR